MIWKVTEKRSKQREGDVNLKRRVELILPRPEYVWRDVAQSVEVTEQVRNPRLQVNQPLVIRQMIKFNRVILNENIDAAQCFEVVTRFSSQVCTA